MTVTISGCISHQHYYEPKFKRISQKVKSRIDFLSNMGVFDKEILYLHFGNFKGCLFSLYISDLLLRLNFKQVKLNNGQI